MFKEIIADRAKLAAAVEKVAAAKLIFNLVSRAALPRKIPLTELQKLNSCSAVISELFGSYIEVEIDGQPEGMRPTESINILNILLNECKHLGDKGYEVFMQILYLIRDQDRIVPETSTEPFYLCGVPIGITKHTMTYRLPQGFVAVSDEQLLNKIYQYLCKVQIFTEIDESIKLNSINISTELLTTIVSSVAFKQLLDKNFADGKCRIDVINHSLYTLQDISTFDQTPEDFEILLWRSLISKVKAEGLIASEIEIFYADEQLNIQETVKQESAAERIRRIKSTLKVVSPR